MSDWTEYDNRAWRRQQLRALWLALSVIGGCVLGAFLAVSR